MSARCSPPSRELRESIALIKKLWAEERVTTHSWDAELGRHQERQSFIGDYIGAGASGDVVWAGFPDASNGVAPVISAARVTLG